jgi:branched-chain amino acid transport system ATP-binding protein
MTAAALELSGVTRRFGGLCAVDSVDLRVERGCRQGLLGPNGAGKSTLFKLITGNIPVSEGTISFAGDDITATAEHRRACNGIAQTFQHSSLFPTLSCIDNVVLAVQRVRGDGHRLSRRTMSSARDEARVALKMCGLHVRNADLCSSLSHGERRQLEIAVAIACNPKLLMLDEPAAGMSPAETDRLAELLLSLPDSLTLIVIEHDLDFVFRVVDTVAVMHLGRLVANGPAADVRASADVERVYLGGADATSLFLEPTRLA